MIILFADTTHRTTTEWLHECQYKGLVCVCVGEGIAYQNKGLFQSVSWSIPLILSVDFSPASWFLAIKDESCAHEVLLSLQFIDGVVHVAPFYFEKKWEDFHPRPWSLQSRLMSRFDPDSDESRFLSCVVWDGSERTRGVWTTPCSCLCFLTFHFISIIPFVCFFSILSYSLQSKHWLTKITWRGRRVYPEGQSGSTFPYCLSKSWSLGSVLSSIESWKQSDDDKKGDEMKERPEGLVLVFDPWPHIFL